MYSLCKGGPEVLPRKILESLAGKAFYHIFKAYCLYFYFSLISFLYFFLLFLALIIL